MDSSKCTCMYDQTAVNRGSFWTSIVWPYWTEEVPQYIWWYGWSSQCGLFCGEAWPAFGGCSRAVTEILWFWGPPPKKSWISMGRNWSFCQLFWSLLLRTAVSRSFLLNKMLSTTTLAGVVLAGNPMEDTTLVASVDRTECLKISPNFSHRTIFSYKKDWFDDLVDCFPISQLVR